MADTKKPYRECAKSDDEIITDFYAEFKRPPSKEELEYFAARSCPFEEKTTTSPNYERDGFKPKENAKLTEKDKNGVQSLTHKAGVCPCVVCGHETMFECEELYCDCCSEICT